MGRTQLHLVDAEGSEVLPSIKAGVESAFAWTVNTYPNLDPAVLAEWAEEIGCAMQTNKNTHATPRRYAYAAMHGRVRDYLKTGASRETPEGSCSELEKWAGVDNLFPGVDDEAGWTRPGDPYLAFAGHHKRIRCG